MPSVIPVTPLATRANVDWTLARMAERVGNEYVYGGQFDPTDINVGCDCSALVAFILNGVLYGPRATFRRVDAATGAWITTESWRPVEVGDVGPFGTICVASPDDIPDDAIVRIALHHGPGGGVASHTWCEVADHRFESNGSRGCVTNPDALAIDCAYANDWAYLPGPLSEPNNEPAVPACEETTEDCGLGGGYRLGLGDHGSAVVALQLGLARVFPAYCGSLGATGVYDGPTVAAVSEFQRRILSGPTGIVDQATLEQLAHYGVVLPLPETAPVAADLNPVATPEPAPEVSPPVAPVPDPLPPAVITYPAAEAAAEAEHQGADYTGAHRADENAPPPQHRELLDTITSALSALANLLDK